MKESIIAEYKVEMILPAEKNVVSYPRTNRRKGIFSIGESRVLFRTKKGNMIVPYDVIGNIDKAPKGWCPGEESRAFSVDCTMKGNRYKIVVFTSPLTRDIIVERLRREMVGNCRIYFKYPAMRGGVMDNSDRWKKGILELYTEHLALRGKGSSLEIPYETIIDHGKNLYVGDSRGMPTLTIINHSEEEEVGAVIIGQSRDLSNLEDYLRDITEKIELNIELPDELNQILLVLNTGVMDERDIAEIMDLEVMDVEKLMDRLIEMKLVKLVRIKRDVELTRGSMRYVNQIIRGGFG